MDRDPVRSDSELLSLRLGTREIQEKKLIDKWLESGGTENGKLRVQALWLPLTDDPNQLPIQLAEIAALQSSLLCRKETREGFSTVPIDVGHVNPLAGNPNGFALFSCLALVWLDSAWHLPESSSHWRMAVRAGGDEQHSWIATETSSGVWAWKQSFIFNLKSAHDVLSLKLRSGQGSVVKGRLKVRLEHLLQKPQLCTGNVAWNMALNTDRNVWVRMECTLKILSPAGKAMENLKVINRKLRETPPMGLRRLAKAASRNNLLSKSPDTGNDANGAKFYSEICDGLPPPAPPNSASPKLPPRWKKEPSSEFASLKHSRSSTSLNAERQTSVPHMEGKSPDFIRKKKNNDTTAFVRHRKSQSLDNIPFIDSGKESLVIRSLKKFKMRAARRHAKDIFTSTAMQASSAMSASSLMLSGGAVKDPTTNSIA
ncbi:uncharacterized protein LOC108683276 [Hyalella azteca]|uniref:Uncharacterized protein LOC108683276 n=1 Tax=Hyalella azteca TaxID=294128 RepID=A0A8B7PS94_HYAAZ|nr:uncharacterized protein LOC108683276 [Hyalella azteca]